MPGPESTSPRLTGDNPAGDLNMPSSLTVLQASSHALPSGCVLWLWNGSGLKVSL
jgi:hypothetical protein